jgi:hypothetical protein
MDGKPKARPLTAPNTENIATNPYHELDSNPEPERATAVRVTIRSHMKFINNMYDARGSNTSHSTKKVGRGVRLVFIKCPLGRAIAQAVSR